MEITLDFIEVRILGCLIEKEITTPDYYPMTLNSLTNACNQKSNRSPVLSVEETAVVRGLESLHEKGLAEKLIKTDSRVPKYAHCFRNKYNVTDSATALLCELMLRGAQTAGELRSRAGRMYKFRDIEEVEETLQGMMNNNHPMVVRLPRQAGRKERRCMHLFSGQPDIEATEPILREEPATLQVRSENSRITAMENEIAALRKELEVLAGEFRALKSQFE